MTALRYVVGIDLGTTHCAVATALIERPALHLLDVPQLVAPGEVAGHTLLPSFLYLPAPGELTAAQTALPWGEDQPVVGELARRLGAKAPNRVVASAKSWVCHGGVNRRAPILPWSAPDSEPHVSPFAAQVAYLSHLRSAWEQRYGQSIAEQDVVVTVPASFDEVARELTTQAAAEAGLGAVRLLEEPQAAFYDFLGERRDQLDHDPAKLVLVVDVGGGTTDLTLLRVAGGETGEAGIERIAVGGHLMLGGDNMDAALAVSALEAAGLDRPSDATVWSGLVMSAREAKERLLGEDPPAQAVLSLQGRGSRLMGNTRSLPITAERAQEVLIEGFLPRTGPSDMAGRAARAGLTTLGLPYTSDTAIPRHVCAFLRRHARSAEQAGATLHDGLPRPDLVLLNGGVFKSSALVERMAEVLHGWFGEAVGMLDPTSLDTAVASGAARSALARHGVGEWISGGAARAYYIEVDNAEGGKQLLCIAPKGMEDGTTIDVPGRVFDAVLERLVSFRLLAFAGDRSDAAGALASRDDDDAWEAVASLETVLRSKASRDSDRAAVSVTLRSTVTETGALELYLVTVALPPERWRLGFGLYEDPVPESETPSEDEAPVEPPDPAVAAVDELLTRGLGQRDPGAAKRVRQDLEQVLGPRGRWSAATCRALFAKLMAHEPGRETSDQHELAWLRLCGWCLRPGLGHPGDPARVDELWALHDRGLLHPSKANWSQWWVLWRQVAAGLDATRQQRLFASVEPWLWREGKPPAGPHAHGPVEMMQLLAALERLHPSTKVRIGELLWTRIRKLGSYWALGRVGARAPFVGDRQHVVAAATAAAWVERLCDVDWTAANGAGFAAASMARRTGDPHLDVSDALRQRVADRLAAARAPTGWREMLSGAGDGDDKSRFGDSLPSGLRLA
ncbi:MAG: molecular chaperone DnaK [Myxococcales bacterium FL481]|nr:MAG: molecular chaperone DnaK [Myxococcales bacterium FL481]